MSALALDAPPSGPGGLRNRVSAGDKTGKSSLQRAICYQAHSRVYLPDASPGWGIGGLGSHISQPGPRQL